MEINQEIEKAEVKEIAVKEYITFLSVKINHLNKTASDAVANHHHLEIKSNDDLQIVADKRRLLNKIKNDIKEQKDNIKRPFLDACTEIENLFRAENNRVSEAIDFCNKLVVDYTNRIEKIRLEEQRKADEAAKKERLRLEEEAAKVLKIAQEKAEEIARQEAAARMEGDTEKADKLALKSSAVIDKAEQKADNLSMLSTVVAPAPLQTEPAKVSGLAMKEEWYHIIVDANKIPREYLLIDDQGLSKLAKASKGKVSIPGVEFKMKLIPMQTRK